MTVQNANRMKFMFFLTSNKAVQVCCCSLKIGSFIFAIISILSSTAQIVQNENVDETYQNATMILCAIEILLSILFTISVISFNFCLAYFCWIIYTIYCYIAIILFIISIILLFQNYQDSSFIAFGFSIIILSLSIMLYFNYIIYSVAKTIGFGQKALLNGDFTATEIVGLNSSINTGLINNSNMMINNNQQNQNDFRI